LEKLPIKNNEESPLVAEGNEISNLKLVDDIYKIVEFIESKVSCMMKMSVAVTAVA
jgi:hypothetical protein